MSAFGRRIADAQDAELRARSDRGARERFVLAALAPRPTRRGPTLAIVALVAAAAVILFFVVRRPPLAFESDGHAIALGEWIAKPVVFSDGTRLELAGDARARVTSVDHLGARVVLEQGEMRAAVVHRSGTSWTISAGPFEVRVTGTRFDVRWDPTTETFVLALHEGSVVVTGPLVDEGRAVVAGETLSVAARENKLEIVRGEASAGAPPKGAEPATSTSVSASPSPPASSTAVHRATWQELAARARYKEAIELVDAEGFDAIIDRSSAKDLLVLTDVARLGGRAAKTASILTAIRARFPGTPEAATAAFLFGRAAFEAQSSYTEAERWFTTYLSEQPGGSLAREASGRILECRVRRGDKAGARAAAKAYLDAYPGGPHAEQAQAVLAE